MNGINVQCRLMPDMVESTTGYAPGIYYNLLVSSTDTNGNHVPASVRFRATKALNDPSHSGIGTAWSKPIRTSVFGHVLWSINALTDIQPSTIEVEVTQNVPKEKKSTPVPVVIEVQPALNLIGFLRKLSIKTEQEWRTYFTQSKQDTAYADFAAGVLWFGIDAVLNQLKKDDIPLEALMTQCYTDHSGIAQFNLALGQKSANLFSTTSNIALDETRAFERLMGTATSEEGGVIRAGEISALFVQDVHQLMEVLTLMLGNDQQKLRDLFQWIDLDLAWESIGDSYILMKYTLEAGLLMAKQVGTKSDSEWIQLIDLFQGLMQKTSPIVGGILSEALPIASGIQDDWCATVPDLPNPISINHQQFELGWLSWRISHSFPKSSSGFKDLINSFLKSCDLDKIHKALHDLVTALEGLDISEEIENDLTKLMSFFSQVLQGDSTQVAEKLLKGGPELSAMEDLPNQVFKIINTIATKSKAIPELVTAIAEIVEALFTTSLPMPFMEAIQPWFTPKQTEVTESSDKSGICLMDCLVLMLVTPTTKVYMDANGKLPSAVKELHNTESWMLDKIPFQQIIAQVVKGYEAQHQVSAWALDHPPPMPIPGILSQLRCEEEVFDALVLFFKILNGFRSAIEATAELGFEALVDAQEEVASALGEEDLKDAANDLDWVPVIEKLVFCCFDSINYSIKCNINLLETAKLYLLNNEPKAKFAHVGPVDVVVFNPVYPEWVGLGREFWELAMSWSKFTVEFILAINEDEEVGAGAADLEVSGAAYTVSDDTMRKILKWCYRLVPVFTFIPDTALKLLTLTNMGLYSKSDIADVRPLAQSAFSDLKRGHSASSGTQHHTADLAKYADPTHNFTVTKIVLAIVAAIASKLKMAAPLIRKIPYAGPVLSYELVLNCLVTSELCSDAIIVIECYQFREKYGSNKQSPQELNHTLHPPTHEHPPRPPRF